MKPQEPIPHNYSIRRLNWIFALSSLGLLVVTGLIVGYDYIRGWKWFQLEFMRMQSERIVQEMQVAKSEENTKQLSDLDEQVRKNSLELAAHRNQYLAAQRAFDAVDGDPVRHRHAHDVDPGRHQRGDLLQRGVDVGGLRRRHRLHADARVAADRHVTDDDLTRFPSLVHS